MLKGEQHGACWVVTGERGEYSDHSLWLVRVFGAKCEANAFQAQAQESVDSIREELGDPLGEWDWDEIKASAKRHSALDPGIDEDGYWVTSMYRTTYSVTEVPWVWAESMGGK